MIQTLLLLKYLPFLRKALRPFLIVRHPSLEREFSDSIYRNPVGISAGIDREGQFYRELSTFGPSFIELGPVKKVDQILRNLRLRSDRNAHIIVNLNGRQYSDDDSSLKEIDRSCSLLYDFADALTISVSGTGYQSVIDRVLTIRQYNDDFKPVAVKISGKIDVEAVGPIVRYALQNGVDAIEVADILFDEVYPIAGGIVPIIVISALTGEDDASMFLKRGASFIAYMPQKSLGGLLRIRKILNTLIKK